MSNLGVIIPIPSLGTFWEGTAVFDTGTFVNAAGVETDPSTIAFQYALEGRPKVILTGGSITRIEQGVYQVVIDTTGLIGIVTCVWIGTGNCATAGPAQFTVEALPI